MGGHGVLPVLDLPFYPVYEGCAVVVQWRGDGNSLLNTALLVLTRSHYMYRHRGKGTSAAAS